MSRPPENIFPVLTVTKVVGSKYNNHLTWIKCYFVQLFKDCSQEVFGETVSFLVQHKIGYIFFSF